MTTKDDTRSLCADDELGYLRSRTVFVPGEGLVLDESYRLAHLPLVAPTHPRMLPRRAGKGYEMGRHERIFSFVLPVPEQALASSAAYTRLDSELKASPFSPKIAWNLLPRRQGKLHATLCGSLGTGEEPPVLDASAVRELAALGPIEVELRGLFSGNVNVGRLYLRAYPECRNGINMFKHIQTMLGHRETDLYVVGLYNLVDDLDAVEASALARLIETWWDRPILRFRAEILWMLGSKDDLVLDSRIASTVRLR
jgi:hypothetical protein